MSVLRGPAGKTGGPSRVASSRKAKVSVVAETSDTESMDTAQPATMSPVVLPDPLSAARGEGAQEGPVGEMTVNFTLPSGFLDNSVLDETNLLPHLNNYLLPSFRKRFDGLFFQEKESQAVGFLFLALQACLAIQGPSSVMGAMMNAVLMDEHAALAKEKSALEHEEAMSVRLDQTLGELRTLTCTRDEINSQLKESLSLMHDQREKMERVKESETAKRKELEELGTRLLTLEGKFKELSNDNESTFSYARLAARAAIMRRHLSGKDPLSMAKEQLEAFLNGIGTEKDLDLEDERNDVEELANGTPPGQG